MDKGVCAVIHQASVKIADFLTGREIKNSIAETDTCSYVKVIFKANSIPSVTINLISTGDDNDAAVRIFDLVMVPESKRPAVLQALNGINAGYRYAKFVLNMTNSTVQLEMDIPMKVENVGEIALELILRAVDIADKAYPTLMKAVWG